MTEPKKMPKGGRIGGTMFPRVRLKDAVVFARKLVSKTHTGAQPATVILSGVFGAAGPNGQVRASALKQYDLLSGTPKAYTATDLAREIVAAPTEELAPHLAKAFFKVKPFKTLFDTFCNDTVSVARIRQQALNLKVHPEVVDECVELFLLSAADAELANRSGTDVTFGSVASGMVGEPIESEEGADETDLNDVEEENTKESENETEESLDGRKARSQQPAPKSKASLEIKIDPSMDPEKLDKLLGVLKKYGQI